ncbi:GNAT family N-acetyltransferase [Thalassospira sp. MA62]|nr:GNAT family N-acetyltransferase [Thalassospira sp. MA62]
MASSTIITVVQNPQDVPFERLVDILIAAFAGQDGIVDPPSSANSVTVSELQWRFARDQLFVARDQDRQVIGQVWVEDVGRDAYLYKLSVDPAFRGRGIGKKLIETACEYARNQGKNDMRLHVRIELKANIALFRACGFDIIGEGRHDGYDRATFWKMARAL